VGAVQGLQDPERLELTAPNAPHAAVADLRGVCACRHTAGSCSACIVRVAAGAPLFGGCERLLCLPLGCKVAILIMTACMASWWVNHLS